MISLRTRIMFYLERDRAFPIEINEMRENDETIGYSYLTFAGDAMILLWCSAMDLVIIALIPWWRFGTHTEKP